LITWTNDRRKLRDLVPWDHNPREINKREAERLGDSLAEFGQPQTLAIGPDNEIYDGHQRRYVWASLTQYGPDYEVDVRVSSRPLTEKERQKLVIYLHKGTVGQWDWDELADTFDVPDLLEWGFDESELQLDWGKDAAPDPGAQVDKAAELQEKWQVERGQIWQVGRHRVMCGDSTCAEDVGRLYDGATLAMVWTDPPYGVDYGAKNRYLQSIGRADRLLDDIQGDDLKPEQVYELARDALARLVEVAKPGAVAYVASPAGTLLPWFIRAMIDSGFEYKHQLVWVKNQLVFGRCDYMYKHEAVLYGWIQNGAHYFEPVTNNCSVFEFNRPRASKLHPTEKPDELVAAMIQNSSVKNEIVGEAFCGSGTTLVACEQTNRIGYGMEIEPKYVAVTLERLTGMGLEPMKLDEG
jgi:DNA modification methylase